MEKLKLIHVGVGGWGASWVGITASSPEFEVVGFVDVSSDNLRAAIEHHDLAEERCYTDLQTALEEQQADAAVIVTPPTTHAEVAAVALAKGLHVMVEKPIAESLDEGVRMLNQAAEADRILMVSQNYRYRRSAQTVKRVLDEGILGPIGHITIDFRRSPHFRLPDVKHADTSYRLVPDTSTHHFDQLRGLTGVEPSWVSARSINPEWSWMKSDPIVAATMMSDDGVLVNYSASWVSQGPSTTWDGDWRIDCEAGQIEWAQNRVMVRPKDNYYTVFHPGLTERLDFAEAELVDMEREDRWHTLRLFSEAIRTGREPETSGRDNLRTLALTTGVVRSAAERAPIDVSALRAEALRAGGRAY